MTYPFGNINIGSYPDDGTGDPLRNAFNTINHNFANIANGNAQVYAPVQSVAGRIGNVVLSINDISGAASFAYVTAGVTSANAYTDSQIAIVNANVNALSANITANVTASVIANINLAGTNANIAAANVAIAQLQANDVTQNSSISSLNSSVVTIQNSNNANSANITLLQSGATATNAAIVTANTAMKSYVDANAVAQLSQISGANAAIVTANTAMKSYVDTQDSAITSAWQNNAGAIYNTVTGITANVVAINVVNSAQSSNISSLQSNSVTQFTWLNNLTASVGSVQSSLVTLQNNQSADEANITLLQSASTGTNVAIITANTAMKSYVDANAVAQLSQISGANAAIVTANTAMKSYVDAVTTAWTANAGTQTVQINSINANITAINLVIGNHTTNISSLQSNSVTQFIWLNNLTASVGSISSTLVTLENTLTADEANIRLLQSGATATNVAVATVTANVNSIYANVTTGPISVTANVTGGNVIATGYVYSHGSPIFGSGNIRFTGNNISSTSGNVTIVNDTVMTGNLFLGNSTTSIHNILGNVVFGPALDLVASADSIITVNPGTATPASSNNTVHVQAIDGKASIIGIDSYGNVFTSNPVFSGRRARGTTSSPSNVAISDILTVISGYGYGTTGFIAQGTTSSTSIRFVATENYTDTAQGSQITFNTMRNGSNNAIISMVIDNTGNIVMPVTTPSGNISTGALVVKGGAGFAGNVNVGGTIYGNVVANVLNTITTTVSSLPSASAVGAGTRAFVTDANTTTFNSAVSGSGGNAMPVFSTGTSWRIG